MEQKYKDILGGAFVLGVVGLGLKFASEDAEKEYGSAYREGFTIVPATEADFNLVYDMFTQIILGGRRPMGGEQQHIQSSLRQAINSGNCALMVDQSNNQKIGFVWGEPGNLTAGEMGWPGSRPTAAFSRYERMTGFKGFGLGLIPDYRGMDLGLELMDWMKSRARQYGASYIWLGANSDLNNRRMWASRTDVVGEGPNVTFFASDVNNNLFQGR